MSINGISIYTALSALYGQDLNAGTSSDPLLEVDNTKQSDIFSTLGTAGSSSLYDSVDLSQTAGFFSKLKQLEQSDPDKYTAVVKKLGEKLQNARGYEGQVFALLARQVAEGADITEVITQNSTGTDLSQSTGTGSSQIKQLISDILSKLNSDT
ncbi:MAG TPA: hypothetical protein VMU10_08200 [Desulfomonilia bacterium]|nr:hypothetical protein [Desulfomonilia bacterium]